MNWLSFFIGVLVGWAVEWVIDLVYWRRRYRSCLAEKEALEARLAEARARIKTLENDGKERERLRLSGTEAVTLAAPVVPGIERVPAGIDAAVRPMEVALPGDDRDVDLQAQEPALPGVERDAGVEPPGPDLHATVEAFEVRQPRLEAPGEPGPERHAAIPAPAATHKDDLKLIEGIGPKIAQVLNDNGILTFAQLATTSTDRLREILHTAGPNFQLADPATWPEQARLAAAGAWEEFEALQHRLTAGRAARPRER